jgi:acyl-CoA thioesterase-1
LLTIVALGDSLTAGLVAPSPRHPWGDEVPYTALMERWLAEAGLDGVRVVNRGVSGELTEEMLLRFDADVAALVPDIVVVLGGSNDLGWGLEPAVIMANLDEMYRRCAAIGAGVVACTVPSIRGYDPLIGPRLLLNHRIQQRCAADGIACVDLLAATAEPKTNRLRAEYTSDGLHLSVAGYARMAEAIWEVLEPVVRRHLTKEGT